MLSWSSAWAAYRAPGGHKTTHLVLGHFVVPNESPALRLRYRTALPLGETLALKAEARDIWPRFREDVERGRYMNAAFLPEVRRTGLCGWHPWFCKYRGLYRQVGVPFFILSLIALPCWLVFRLYRLRTPGHPLSARREILLLTVVVYLLCLATLTLTPNGSSRLRAKATAGIELRPDLASLTCSSAMLSKTPNALAFCMDNAAGNVALFFPLGILLPLVWRRLRFWRGIQIAIALSCSIELLQYLSRAWGSYRSMDVNDVMLNVLGASLGLALVSLLRLRQGTRPAVPRA
jgi:glycopeptide antibiotics resistance protein